MMRHWFDENHVKLQAVCLSRSSIFYRLKCLRREFQLKAEQFYSEQYHCIIIINNSNVKVVKIVYHMIKLPDTSKSPAISNNYNIFFINVMTVLLTEKTFFRYNDNLCQFYNICDIFTEFVTMLLYDILTEYNKTSELNVYLGI